MSSTEDKIRMRQLGDKSDYALWRIRMKTAISEKKLGAVFNSAPEVAAKASWSEKKEEASNIIFSALSDQALRVFRSVIGDPKETIQKLEDRYDSKRTTSNISKISKLISIQYSSIHDEISKHTDQIAAITEILRGKKTILED